MRMRLQHVMITLLSATLLTACFQDPGTIRTDPSTTLPQTGEITTITVPVETVPEETKPQTVPVTVPETIPATVPETTPVTIPETKPETRPETSPQTDPTTEPDPGSGKYAGISNKEYEWSYGYPDSWVTKYSGYWNYGDNDLYLTFDLGYEGGYTSNILDTLRKKGVSATFFVTTEYMEEEPQLVKQMLSEGHKIGNHSTGHRNMVDLVGTDGVSLKNNTQEWEYVFHRLTGKSSHLYRAPEGVFSRRGMTVLEEMGYDTIFWGAAYADWDEDDQPSLETAKEKLYKYISGGDVVLLHPFRTNSELLPIFIDDMRAKGYDFKLLP